MLVMMPMPRSACAATTRPPAGVAGAGLPQIRDPQRVDRLLMRHLDDISLWRSGSARRTMNAWFARVGAVRDSQAKRARQAPRLMAMSGRSNQSEQDAGVRRSRRGAVQKERIAELPRGCERVERKHADNNDRSLPRSRRAAAKGCWFGLTLMGGSSGADIIPQMAIDRQT